MTRHFDMPSGALLSTVAEERLVGSDVMLRPSEGNMPPIIAAELEGVAKRVRMRLKNMTATIIEIGHELRGVKRRLKRGQFLEWTAACDIAPRHAQLMMRAAEWAEGRDEIVSHLEPTAIYLLAAPSTPTVVRHEVLHRLEAGERPAPGFIKGMIRAAKGERLGPLPNSKEAEIEGLLKYCGYTAVPDHLAQFSAPSTKRTQRAGLKGPMDDWTTTPVAAGASPSSTGAGSGETANVL